MSIKQTLYAIFLFVVVAAPLYYLAGSSLTGITGRAVEEGVPPSGEYRIRPDFSIPIKSLGRYEELRSDAADYLKKVDDCIKKPNDYADRLAKEQGALISLCVETEKPKGWDKDCGTPADRLFDNATDGIIGCMESSDTDCICTVKPESAADITVEMDIQDSDDGTYVYQGDLASYIPVSITADLVADGTVRKGKDMLLFLELVSKDRKTQSTLFINDLSHEIYMDIRRMVIDESYPLDYEIDSPPFPVIKRTTIDYGKDGMILHKSDIGLVFIRPEEAALLKDTPSCTLAPKHYYKFCVKADNAYTWNGGSAAKQPLEYRFALDFSPKTI